MIFDGKTPNSNHGLKGRIGVFYVVLATENFFAEAE